MKISLPIKKIKDFFSPTDRSPKLLESLKRTPRFFGERPFLSFLSITVFALCFSGLVFYNYVYLAEKTEPEIIERPLLLKKELYSRILEKLQAREKQFEEISSKQYPDLFRKREVVP